MKLRRSATRFPIHRLVRVLALLSWLVLFLPPVGTPQEQSSALKRVLIFYDENKDFSGLALLDRSITSALKAGANQRLDIYTEFMDLSRFSDERYEERLREFFRQKYSGKKIDLIIAVMGPSLDFALKHGAEIFPETPVVFCGIDSRELKGRSLRPNVTGVLVKREFKPTLDLALRLQPSTRQVIVIAGVSEFNRYWEQEAQRELREFEGRVAIKYLTGLPMDEIQKEVASLPPNTIILYMHIFKDGAGNTFKPNESLSLVAERANAPIYVFFDQYLGYGAVGGHVYSLERHGDRTAQLGLRILGGEKPADIPVLDEGSSVTMLDWRQLRRWGIGEDRAPPGSVVRFTEASFWDIYKWQIIGVVSLCIVEALLIFALLLNRAGRRRAEKTLRQSEELHRVVLSNISDAVFITDNKGAFTFICPNVDVIFGYSFEEAWSLGHITRLLGRNLFSPNELAASGEIRNIEREIKSKSGAERTLLAHVKRVSIQDGTILYVCRDVTDLRESRARIEDLAGRLIIAQEEERKYLARELHDDLNQQVAALAIGLSKLKRQLPEAGAGALSQVTKLQDRATELSDRIRRLSHHLHSSTLEHVGLTAALKAYCEEFTEREGIAISLRIQEGLEAIPPDAALCLYRVTQEALRNVAKHSGGKAAEVMLSGSRESLQLSVADQGQGFDRKQAESGRGLGLVSMEERVKLLRGSFEVKTQPGAGAELRAQIPIGN